MKSLNLYINEKLTINKHFKRYRGTGSAKTPEGKIKSIFKLIDPSILTTSGCVPKPMTTGYNNSYIAFIDLRSKDRSYIIGSRLDFDENLEPVVLHIIERYSNQEPPFKDIIDDIIDKLNNNGIDCNKAKFAGGDDPCVDVSVNSYEDLYDIFSILYENFVLKYSASTKIDDKKLNDAFNDLLTLFAASRYRVSINNVKNIVITDYSDKKLRILPGTDAYGWCAKLTHDKIHNNGIVTLFKDKGKDGYFDNWENLYKELIKKYSNKNGL